VQVVDRLKARIKQGTQIPYPTTSANTGTQVQLVNADLLLEVTPTIYPDGRILMKLKVTDNAPGASFNGFTSITTREAETNMIVRDGDTAVIGGILRKNYTRLRQGWPGLMNVPLVNLLFGNNTVEDVVRELLVFVTPTIVKRPPPAS
jgi:type IV pilus assembly protein PilQ